MKNLRILIVLVVIGLFLPLTVEVKAASKNVYSTLASCKKKATAKAKAACAAMKKKEMEKLRRAHAAAAARARARAVSFQRNLHVETKENIANDNTIGEDLEVRKVAQDSLGSHAGTVVVMNAKTGQLITVVNQDWAIRRSQKICSVVKLVTGVAGLEEKVITEDGVIAGSSSSVKLDYAIAKSKNGFFQQVGQQLSKGKFTETARKFGLGQKTGIGVPGEATGKLPNKLTGRSFSHSDGLEASPLQLAVMVTAITRGEKVVPYFGFSPPDSTVTQADRKVSLALENMQSLLSGMKDAPLVGTARFMGVAESDGVAGKTGSCIGNGSWVGLFASVAPIEDPKYTVVVVTRGLAERGRIAASIAGPIYNHLLKKEPVAIANR